MDNPLFSFDDDWQNNACINYSHAQMSFYIDGYKRAADLLAKNVIESNRDQDILVYPIAFLYRQYIELQLKDIIRESRIFLEDSPNFPEHHKIQPLWDLANKLMREIIAKHDKSAGEYITEEDIKIIGDVVSNFVKVDPDSFAFRYPEDKQGNNTMSGLQHINIRKLAQQINLMSDSLKKFDLVVGLMREWQDDMRQTYGQ